MRTQKTLKNTENMQDLNRDLEKYN